MAEKSSFEILRLLSQEKESEEPQKTANSKIWLNSITGAPGNGNNVLYSAIKSSLLESGIIIEPSPGESNLSLSGEVTMMPEYLGKQIVEVLWILKTFRGVEVGRARQRKAVPKKELGGDWVMLSKNISSSAITAIVKISANKFKLR